MKSVFLNYHPHQGKKKKKWPNQGRPTRFPVTFTHHIHFLKQQHTNKNQLSSSQYTIVAMPFIYIKQPMGVVIVHQLGSQLPVVFQLVWSHQMTVSLLRPHNWVLISVADNCMQCFSTLAELFKATFYYKSHSCMYIFIHTVLYNKVFFNILIGGTEDLLNDEWPSLPQLISTTYV